MEWAEEFGLGEMGLSSAEFWSLTVREFWIKHAAFTRAEDRRRSLMIEHSLISFAREDHARDEIQRTVNVLRRYPVKKWLRGTDANDYRDS